MSMKKFICMFALVFVCQARADDLIESLEPVAAAPQVIVVYRNQCPDNQEINTKKHNVYKRKLQNIKPTYYGK